MPDYRGQLGADRWVAEEVFPGIAGYFVDVGAYDGMRLSNTWALEGMGWTGICVEPSRWFGMLQARRKCILDNRAAWSCDGRMKFSENGMLGRLDAAGDGEEVVCATLEHILDDHNAPSFIHFLSLDVEGSELEVLRVFPWERYQFGAIAVEHAHCNKAALSFLLSLHGYGNIREVEHDLFCLPGVKA